MKFVSVTLIAEEYNGLINQIRELREENKNLKQELRNMKYKCIKEMCIPKHDGGGFEKPNEYGFVTVGDIWERDDREDWHVAGEIAEV